MRRRALVASLLAVTACEKDPGSNLERMAAERPNPAIEEPARAAADSPEKAAPDVKAPEPGEGAVISTGEGERVELRLSLIEGTKYQVTTIGLITLPAIEQPVGFARREEIELSGCDGEGFARACDLTHRMTNYEAELPTGGALETGEKPVMDLVSRHRIDATGARDGETTVEGDAEALEHPDAKALKDAHRLYCLSLPSEPVGVGAQWTNTCRMRSGGQVVTKHAQWTLAKLDTGADGSGRRAELHVQSKYLAVDVKGDERAGVSRGVMYFWADAGEPHLYRESIVLPLGAKGLKTKTSLRFQFAKVDPKDPDKVIRTDGKPFSGFRTLNEVKKGEDTDDEPAPEKGAKTAPDTEEPS